MQKIIYFIILIFLLGCSSKNEPKNYIVSSIDKFTNEQIIFTNEDCLNLDGKVSLCTKFKIINNEEAYLYIGQSIYHLYYDSNFLRSIWLKIDGSKEFVKIDRPFRFLTVDDNTYYKYEKTVKIDYKIYSFIKSSIGKKVLLRFIGKNYYKDYEFEVKSDGKGQFQLFLNNFNPTKIKSLDN